MPKPAYPPYPAGAPAPGGAAPAPSTLPTQSYPQQGQSMPTVQQQQQSSVQPQPANRGGPAPNNRRPNPLHSAAASLETVERALGDLRVNAGGAPPHAPRGGRRGHGGRQGETQLKVPTTDFDFESSNAKFDKAAHSPVGAAKEGTEDGTATSGSESAAAPAEKDTAPAYNPQKSFFDSLSSATGAPQQHSGSGHQGNYRGRRGGAGPGGAGRNRREEEREKNVATFGEPGGVGLLGPGGYVGGWGGYGRRGGRPRRGGGGSGRGGANGAPAVQTQARG